MWERSEKHTALALLFVIAAAPVTGWVASLMTICAVVHAVMSVVYAFKGD
jgi:hypothetical protein